ncbi:hypothetical protein H0H93_012166 [Arthromyces matolae]|nr:hypothetical protein H0H93_012166 [Arthromyces matolae]
MLLGWLFARKTYSFLQVVSVLLVTLGVILTTLSASPVRVSESKGVLTDSYTYATGIVILTLALVFSGFLGLVQDWTYSRYGRPSLTTSSSSQPPAWQESMFYLHFLALPMFVSVRHDLLIQIHALNSGPRLSLPGQVGSIIPAASVPLIINTLTQLLCVSGVNRLTTKVTALTVTLILVVRKAVSLLLSVIGVGIIQRGNGSHSDVDKRMLWSGAGMVLVGTVIYSLGSKAIGKIDNKKKA